MAGQWWLIFSRWQGLSLVDKVFSSSDCKPRVCFSYYLYPFHTGATLLTWKVLTYTFVNGGEGRNHCPANRALKWKTAVEKAKRSSCLISRRIGMGQNQGNPEEKEKTRLMEFIVRPLFLRDWPGFLRVFQRKIIVNSIRFYLICVIHLAKESWLTFH